MSIQHCFPNCRCFRFKTNRWSMYNMCCSGSSIWWQTFVGCWRGNMMKSRKRKRNPLHRSFEDKKFRKSKGSTRKT